MEDRQQNSSRTRIVLALLPLLLLGAAAWYFLGGRERPAGDAAGAGRPEIFVAGESEEPRPLKEGGGIAAARIPEAYDPKAGMDIQGSAEFRDQVMNALKLVWTADRGSFLFIRRSLQVIRSENRTGFYMENGRAVAALSDDHAFRSVTWCAGVIAHQARHAADARAGGSGRTAPPPPPGETRDLRVEANPVKVNYRDLGDILRAEDRAFELQLKVLRGVGAPAKETRPVFRRAPRDFHLAHDGNYTLAP